ncbi:autotransporter domain-containing protein [Rhizobium sp. YS-1r]|uniref:autotransporter outer membrane beta-barrel domain-containing protein n=1 Tax=Rhizobium sp. YS-1r TaxID=1532558 RepID=UPI00068C08E0|nr:autotransporter domain-containing protein [Rhizobium sp. YS-1r]
MAFNNCDLLGGPAGEAKDGIGDRPRQGANPLGNRSRRAALSAVLASTSSLALAVAAGPAAADEVIDGGQTVTVPGDQNSPWNLGAEDLVVGDAGAGTLVIENGGIVIPAVVQVGRLVGSNGSVTVSGTGSNLTSTGSIMQIGLEGTGFLTVGNGASLNTDAGLVIGHFEGGEGTLTVTGEGTSWATAQQVTVGSQGTGTVYVEDGASVVHGGDLTLGLGTHKSGYVNVSGQGTNWEATSNAIVGNAGNGMLDIRDGATFDVAQDLVVANTLTGYGLVVVNGEGARLTFDKLRAGVDGYAYLIVENGGALGGAGHAISLGTGATGEAGLQITNGSSAAAGTLVAGDFGKGSVIVSGSMLESTEAYLGRETTGTGSVSVSGANAAWYNTGNLFVGYRGAGDVTVQSGATLGSIDSAIGAHAGATGEVTVRDSGSTWYASGDLFVGGEGDGTLTISDQANVWVLVGNGVTNIATVAGSTGVVNIGAAAGAAATSAGNLFTASIQFGAGDGTLVFNHTDPNLYFATAMNGFGAIDLLAGTTIFVSDSAGFTGNTTVDDGATLVANAILGGSVSVLSGGALAGTGTLGTVTLASGATIAPGNSIGTLNVGDITFDAGSLHEVEVDALGNSDLVNAAGIATVNGGTVNVTPYPDVAVGTAYTILTAAGGVNGTFDAATFAINSIFITPTLSYDANNAYVTLDQTTDFPDVALTPNQKAAASGIQSVGGGDLFSAIAVLGSIEEAREAFDAISGEIHASAKTALIEDSRFVRDAVMNRIRTAFEETTASAVPVFAYGPGGPEAAPAATDRFAVWGQGFGSWGQWDGDGNAATMDRSIGGFLFGGDALATENLRLGLLAGYSHSNFDVDDRSSSGSADSYHLGAYGGGRWGGFGLRFGGAYSWHDLEMSRSAEFTGFSDSLTVDYHAATAQMFGEVGHRLGLGNASIEPFANLAHVNLDTGGFTEDGGDAALSAGSQTTNTTFTTLGLRAGAELAVGEARTVRLTGMIGWRHAFGDVVPAATMAFDGGSAFTVAGVPIAEDAAVIEAGLDLKLTPQATFGVSYKGQFGSGVSDHSAKANVAVKF